MLSTSAGSTQRPKKRLELTSLAEQPARQPSGRASPHHAHCATAGQASSAKLAQKSVAGSASGRRAQGKIDQQKVVYRPLYPLSLCDEGPGMLPTFASNSASWVSMLCRVRSPSM